ncbi:MAG: terminase family protein [Pseudomonadota bacterium]
MRCSQRPPKWADWLTWLLIGGRGSGKTLAGATWVHYLANGLLPAAKTPTHPIALVGETLHEVRDVMIDGPSGIRAVAAFDRPRYEATRRRLVWPNGAVAHAFSAHDPEGLRGPQFSSAWCDELAKWPNAQQVWDMLQFGLRLGDWPRQLVTTTPKPIKLLRTIMDDPKTAVSHMKTSENAGNLASPFMDTVLAHYGGTRLGRQELDGEYLQERDDALWRSSMLDRQRKTSAPKLVRIVVAVDPPASSHEKSDACGIVVAGIGEDQRIYVLADRTLQGATPSSWAKRVCDTYNGFGADTVIAEVNQGGDMVLEVIGQADRTVHVTSVHARQSKGMRAEPISMLYEQGSVSHVGTLPELEDEMCNFAPNAKSQSNSPDRVDALVWAIAALTGRPSGLPRVRPV